MGHFLDFSGHFIWIALVAFVAQLVAYIITTRTILNAYRFFWNKGLSKYKIQVREASRADIRREIRSSVSSLAIFSLVYAGVHLGAMAHFFSVSVGLKPLGIPYFLASTVATMVAHDAYFYWTHRLMHHRRLFMRFHRTHHKSVTPTAYACFSFDPPEALVQAMFLPIWLLLVPMQLPGLLVWFTLMFTRNAVGHSGVELFSHGFGGWLVTNTHHDVHHATARHNFGLYFGWWDRLMGTEHPAGLEAGERMRPRRAAEEKNIPSAEISF